MRLDGELDQRRGSLPGENGVAAFEATDRQREMVKSMAGYGMRQVDIGKAMGLSYKTLERHFRTELDLGFGQAVANLSQTLYGLAHGVKDPNDPTKYIMEPSEKSLHFFLERKAGFEPIQKHEVSGPDGKAVQIEEASKTLADNAPREHLVVLEIYLGHELDTGGPAEE